MLIRVLIVFFFLVSSSFASVDLDGIDDKINLAGAGVTSRPIFFSCWFRTDTTGAAQDIIQINDAGTDDEWIRMIITAAGANQTVRVDSQNAGGFQGAEATGTYSADTWHHACGGEASTTSRVAYLDGGNKGTDTGTGNAFTGLDNTTIGVLDRVSITEWFNGEVGECAIWNAELSDADCALLASSRTRRIPCQVKPSNLIHYWPLSDVSEGSSADGVTFRDICGTNGSGITGDNGSNNTGLTGSGEDPLTVP